jgi:hypothetical protein
LLLFALLQPSNPRPAIEVYQASHKTSKRSINLDGGLHHNSTLLRAFEHNS